MIKLNGVKVDTFHFPNNELGFKSSIFPQAKFNDTRGNKIDVQTLELYYDSDSDLLTLLFVRNHLRTFPFDLHIPYFPYSRMDRTENNSVFTLKSVAELINSMNFDRVFIDEPHSDVVMALVNNAIAINRTEELFEEMCATTGDWRSGYIYYPDAGAEKRYSKRIKHDKVLVGMKTRDFATGKITGLQVHGDQDLKGAPVVILDDLCSKGGTFVLGAKALKERNAGNIILVVAHCENAIYDGEILSCGLFHKVYTTDNLLTRDMSELYMNGYQWHNLLHVRRTR